MAKVKAKQTLLGSYGLAKAGDIIEVSDKIAALMIANGLVEEIKEEKPEKAKEIGPVNKEKKEISKP